MDSLQRSKYYDCKEGDSCLSEMWISVGVSLEALALKLIIIKYLLLKQFSKFSKYNQIKVKIMESQQSVNKIIVTTKYCKVHQLKKGKRNSITSGKARIVQSNGLLINVNSFYLTLKPQLQLIRVRYQKSTSYFFQNPENQAIMSFSFPNVNSDPNDAANLQLFQETIRQKQLAVNFQDDSTNQQLIDKIKFEYPQIKSKEIYKPEKVKNAVKSVSYGIGGVFGVISSYFEKPSEKIEQKIDQFSRQSISQKKKQKWQNTKGKVSEVNEKMTQYIKPIAKKGSQVTKTIKQSWTASDNKAIKVFKDLTKTTSEYINKGFQKGMGKQHNDDLQIISKIPGSINKINQTQPCQPYFSDKNQSAKSQYQKFDIEYSQFDQKSKMGLLDDDY